MKLFLTWMLGTITLLAGAQTKTYISASGEMIFSFADIKESGNDKQSELRWSPVFNGQSLVNHDLNKRLGIFYGLAYRNVGFIYKPTTDTLKKYRSYNIGIPVGLKLGNLENGTFLFGGYEIEFPFNFKEKTFIGGDKDDKESAWFSPKQNSYTQSFFVGINFKGGASIKFKYYIDNFFNKDYTETINGVQIKPYSNVDVNVFYISFSWNAFGSLKDYMPKSSGKNNVGTNL